MSQGITIISRNDLQTLIRENHDFTLIEVLPEESFAKQHLPGAINIPGDRLRERAPKVVPDRNSTIVVYCASPSCTASDRAAALLADMGYTAVHDYRGGKEHWSEGGLPVEQGAPAGAAA